MIDAEARRQAFAAAFAAQGRSDWEVYKHLSALTKPSFPQCHALHYLQMATEKIAKAYRIRDTAADVDELVKYHTGFVEFINQFFRCETTRNEFRERDAALQTVQRNATTLARQIEKLAPATDRLARADATAEGAQALRPREVPARHASRLPLGRAGRPWHTRCSSVSGQRLRARVPQRYVFPRGKCPRER